MKGNKYVLLVGILLFVSIFLFAFRAYSRNEKVKEVILPEPIRTDRGKLRIEIFPAMELLSVIQYLSNYHADYNLMTEEEFQYKRDVERSFREFENHPAVSYFEELYKKGFAFDKPPTIIVSTNNDLSLNENRLLDSMGKYRYEKSGYLFDIDDVKRFLELVKDFYLETKFEDFFINHENYYVEVINDTAKSLNEIDLIYSLEEFHGDKKEEYRLILVSLYLNGGYGPEVIDNGKTEVYSIIGPRGRNENKDIPYFGTTDFLSSLVFHEFGHSFIELKTDGIAPFLKNSGFLFEPIYERMKQLAYPDWEFALEETILRATVIYIMADFYPEFVDKELEEEYKKGFIYIKTVYNLLDDYSNNREQYKDFQSYIPIIIKDLMK